MASVQFLLASIAHRYRIGLLLPWEAQVERSELLDLPPWKPPPSDFQMESGYGTANDPPPMTHAECCEYNRKWFARRDAERRQEWLDAYTRFVLKIEDEDTPDVFPLVTGLLDLEDYGDGLVPDELSPIMAEAQDRAYYAWLIRDRIEWARMEDAKRDASTWEQVCTYMEFDDAGAVSWATLEWKLQPPKDLTWIPGTSYGAGSSGSKAWLDDQAAQMRIDYALLRRQARRFWSTRRLARGWSGVEDDPQLRWLVRRSELLRLQYNFRRKCDAIGVNPDAAAFRLYQAPLANDWADRVIAHVNAKATGKLTVEQRDRYLDAFEHALWAYGQAHKKPMPEHEVEELRHELASACLHEMDVLGQRIPEQQPVKARDLIPVVPPRTPRHALMLAVPATGREKHTARCPAWWKRKRYAA